MKSRCWLALLGAKLTYRALRILGRNASHTPGRVALAVCPDYLAQVPKPALTICVTGTNGKTTVTNMIADLLIHAGYRVSTNRIGSNIVPGVAAALTNALAISGRPSSDACVLEVDERACRLVLPKVKPDLLVVTNLFRDSLKRNAFPDFILELIDQNTPAGTKLVLNADDLCSSQLGGADPASRTYFGVDELPEDSSAPSANIVADYSYCPVCLTKLTYRYLRHHHIGQAYCPKCGFESPHADYRLTSVDRAGKTITVAHGDVTETYPLVSDTLFNIYNELAAITALRQAGLTATQIADGLTSWTVVDSRLNEVSLGRARLVKAMSKGQSSVSCSQTMDFVRHQPGRKSVVLIMDDWYDRLHSVEFIGWIYDADFEFLGDPGVVQVVATGPRCYDHQVRLLLAGVAPQRIVCCENELEAWRVVDTDTDAVFLLYDTSTMHQADKVAERLIAEAKR